MIKISAAIENSFSKFMDEFGLEITEQEEKGTWSRTTVTGTGVRIRFYAEKVDHYSSCMIILDEKCSFDCMSVARRLLGADKSAKEIERKKEKYQNFCYGELLQEIEFCCDFIVTHLHPFFEGKRSDFPRLSNHTNNSGIVEVSTYSVANWIQKENSQGGEA